MDSKRSVRVCIIYPTDPLGVIPGGIDTFIRGTLRWAPESVQISLVGVTTNRLARPPGQWTSCMIGNRCFRFYPLFELRNPARQSRIPLSVRFSQKLFMSQVTRDADILEFHRLEPSVAFLRDKRPKTAVIHQNMKAVLDPGADIRWKYLPRAYFLMEDILLPRLNSFYCVREDAVSDYKQRYPSLANCINFIPTWVDTAVFYPLDAAGRMTERKVVTEDLGFGVDEKILVSVGRLDGQKNPLMLLEAFRSLPDRYSNTRLIMIGDGRLRDRLERKIVDYDLHDKVILTGLLPPEQIARYLQVADAFVLSSRYEGMPMCVLEALGCGLPVASTAVGEVSRVVHSGQNGSLSAGRDSTGLAQAITECLDRNHAYRGTPCVLSVTDFSPQKVLAAIYENYHRLANIVQESLIN